MDKPTIDLCCRHCDKKWMVSGDATPPEEWFCPWCGKTTPHREVLSDKNYTVRSFLFPKRYLEGLRADFFSTAKVLYFVDDETFWRILNNNLRRDIPDPDEMPESILIDNEDSKHAVVFIREGAQCFKEMEPDPRCKKLHRDLSLSQGIRRCLLESGHSGSCDSGSCDVGESDK